jgi:hypothetical protein
MPEIGSIPVKVLVAILRGRGSNCHQAPPECPRNPQTLLITCANRQFLPVHKAKIPLAAAAKRQIPSLFFSQRPLLPKKFLKNCPAVFLHDATKHRTLMIEPYV